MATRFDGALKAIASVLNMDAGETTLLARELESKIAENKDVLYQEMRSKEFVPVNTSHPAGTKTIVWRKATKYGRAKILTGYGASDIPSVTRSLTEQTAKVYSVGSKFSYTLQEIKEAAMLNRPLQADLSADSTEYNARLVDQVVWTGDSSRNIAGFLNYPGVTAGTIPADGTNTTKTWSTKTASLIFRDAGNMYKAVVQTTNGVERPDTLLLPLSVYIDIGNRLVDPANGSNKTILAALQENMAKMGVTTIEGLPELETAGTGSTTRCVMYKRDPRKVQQHLPVVYEQVPPQADGLEIKVIGHTRFAGTTFYYPLSAAYGDGI